ncbi:MAG: flagellar FliL protein [Planctomycetota bacterium]|jgi:flagellar FliL protein
MAEEEVAVEAEATGGGKKTLILIIVGALVLVGGSVGGTIAILGVGGSDEPAVEEVAEVVKGDPSYIDLKPPFTVNLAPEDPVSFLQVSMQILTFNNDVAEELEKHKPLIRNNLVVLFGKQQSADLRTPEGKTKLQLAALEVVQSVINKYGSAGEVDNIFFTTFVMQ